MYCVIDVFDHDHGHEKNFNMVLNHVDEYFSTTEHDHGHDHGFDSALIPVTIRITKFSKDIHDHDHELRLVLSNLKGNFTHSTMTCIPSTAIQLNRD